jgi:hypothetical protein
VEVGHPLIDLFNPVSTRQQVCALALYFLALKGSRGFQCMTFIHNFYQRHQVLKSYLSYYRFENLFSTLSGVDEKIKVCDIDDQMHLHPKAPRICIQTQKFTNIKVFNRFEKCIGRMNQS